MRMAMRMVPEQRQVMTMKLSLRLEKAWGISVFPKTEAILNEDGFIDSYFRYICINKKAMLSRYRSVLDFLFCELFGMTRRRRHLLRESCFAYYEGNGPKLVDIMSKTELKIYDIIMARLVLPLIKSTIDSYGKRTISWKKFTGAVERGLRMIQSGEQIHRIKLKYLI